MEMRPGSAVVLLWNRSGFAKLVLNLLPEWLLCKKALICQNFGLDNVTLIADIVAVFKTAPERWNWLQSRELRRSGLKTKRSQKKQATAESSGIETIKTAERWICKPSSQIVGQLLSSDKSLFTGFSSVNTLLWDSSATGKAEEQPALQGACGKDIFL